MPISETAHELFDALDRHDLEAVTAYLRDDFQVSGNVTRPLDKTTYLALLKAYFAAFSDYDFNFSEAAQTGDKLRVKFTVTGTHDGTLDLTPLDIPVTLEATNQRIVLPVSVADLTFDDNDQVESLVMHQAAGGTLNDLVTLLGAETPLHG